MEDIIYGRNPVKELLNSDEEINKILIAKGKQEGSLKQIVGKAKAKKIIVQMVEVQKLNQLAEGENHQGIVAYVSPYQYSSVDAMLKEAEEKKAPPFIILCDEINDPHNLGALIRTAHSAGAHGVVIPKRRSAALNGIVVKTSAGAAKFTKVARVSNLGQVIDRLKKEGLWIACADMDGQPYYKQDLTGPIGIVVGGEGKGVGKLIKSKCDFVVSMPMYGQVNSLNASVAGSILMYDVVRQRNEKAR